VDPIIVAKRKTSKYVSYRSPNWLKIISYETAVVEISANRKDEFGWLTQLNGRTVGVLELAIPAAHKKAFYGVAKSIITGEDRKYVYVKPQIRARVRFRSWSQNGYMRVPEFVDFVV
jgi:DNA ligase-1